ncbi:MAG: single-stranded-DNA-specific exonuclease RecJ [Gammaproteobacteria bacterium]
MTAPARRIVRRDPPAENALAALSGLPPVLARVLAARGIEHPDALQTDLSRLLPPSQLKGIDRAASLLADAVTGGERILVIGDYDADGATSTALCVSLLGAMGADVDFLVPDRFRFGYGLSPEIVEVAAGRRPALILTVDNGISSHAGVARARALGMRVVVTDHHLPGTTLPDADALVNPNQPGCIFPSKCIAGVGVAFCVMTALRGELRARGWFGAAHPEPNLADALDLVALGTVADVVSLDANNRLLVEQGLRRIRAGRVRPGIAALVAVAKRSTGRLVAADLGFAVGPRLNAAGRLDDMALGIRCLLAENAPEAERYAAELDAMNRDRRQIEGDMQQQAQSAMARLALDRVPDGICLFDAGWHPGVVGILASRVRERHHRPVIAFAPADGSSSRELRGSGRSIDGLHIRDVLDAVAAHNPGLIDRFGGHAMAAGLTLARERFAEFAEAFDAEVRRVLPASALSPVLLSDGELPLAELDLRLADALRNAVPWGQGFPAPLFDGEFEVLAQRVVGEKHLKLSVSSADANGRVLDAMAFNVDMAAWPLSGRGRLRLAYRVDVNEYRGLRTPQLIVELAEAV